MLSAFILTTVIVVVITILGGWLVFKTIGGSNDASAFLSVLLLFAGIVGIMCVLVGGGLAGHFGFSTYTETTIPITQFSKALSSDHNSVIIIYEGKPYLFNEYFVVNNYEKITNILVKDRESILGNQVEWNVVIPVLQKNESSR